MEIRDLYQPLLPAPPGQGPVTRERNTADADTARAEQDRYTPDRRAAPPLYDYREQLRGARGQRVERTPFREVYAQEASPHARRAITAYNTHRPSEIPDVLAGFDDYA